MTKEELLGKKILPEQISVIAYTMAPKIEGSPWKYNCNKMTVTTFEVNKAELTQLQIRKAKGELDNVHIYVGPVKGSDWNALEYHWDENFSNVGHTEIYDDGTLGERLDDCTNSEVPTKLSIELMEIWSKKAQETK